jgi:bifunctional DNase/RNase
MKKCDIFGCGKEVDGAVCVVLDSNDEATESAFCRDHVRHVGMDYILPDPSQVHIQLSTATYEPCKLHKLVFSYLHQHYFIILKSTETASVFLMRTGYVEACSIYGAINKPQSSIPLTYQLFERLIHALGGSMVEAVFDNYNKDFHTYESHLVIGGMGGTVKVQCRGSDAVGISFLAKTPIKVNTAFLGRFSTAPGR